MNKFFNLSFILLSLFLINSGVAFSQNNEGVEECGFDKIHQDLLSQDVQYSQDVQKADQEWIRQQQLRAQNANRTIIDNQDTIYEIPVVIHVLHAGAAVGGRYNPGNLILTEWIDYLNDVYAATYPGFLTEPNGGTHVPIRFVLADYDPDCKPTTGINRVDMSSNAAYVEYGIKYRGSNGIPDSTAVKNIYWPTDKYYNIYVVNKFDGEDGIKPKGTYVRGFAYLGVNSRRFFRDGAYILAQAAKEGVTTLPHELAHAFGLYHTFQGSNGSTCPIESDCATQGDLVCDTEPHTSLIGSCPSERDINPCTNAAYGLNGVNRNFMSYSNCAAMFTPGQRDRMLYCLKNFRADLTKSHPGPPVVEEIKVTNNKGTYTFVAHNEYGAKSYLWDFGDGNTSTKASPTHSFDQSKSYKITLTITNDCGDKTITLTREFGKLNIHTIDLSDEIKFYPNPAKNNIRLKNESIFQIKSVSVYNMLGQVVLTHSVANGKQIDLDIQHLTPGLYNAKLILDNGAHSLHKFEVQR